MVIFFTSKKSLAMVSGLVHWRDHAAGIIGWFRAWILYLQHGPIVVMKHENLWCAWKGSCWVWLLWHVFLVIIIVGTIYFLDVYFMLCFFFCVAGEECNRKASQWSSTLNWSQQVSDDLKPLGYPRWTNVLERICLLACWHVQQYA